MEIKQIYGRALAALQSARSRSAPSHSPRQNQLIGQIRKAILDGLFPPRCPINDDRVQHQGTFDSNAWAQLNLLSPPWCVACGLPFEGQQALGALCAPCTAPHKSVGRLTGRGGLDKVRAALAYNDQISPAVLKLKYADRADGVAAFARIMVNAGSDLWADDKTLLVPVPLHHKRLRERGYNQAGLLAAAISKQTGHPVLHRALIRTRATTIQKGGSRRLRAKNVAGAFAVRVPEAISGKNIILVDDVLTTGATLLACAPSLRKAGAAQVCGLTLARVVQPAQYTFE